MIRKYFDIETGPIKHDLMMPMMPEFDPPQNIKDPDKIKAALEEKRQKWINNAPLDPMRSYAISIGFKSPGQQSRLILSEKEQGDPDGDKESIIEFLDICKQGFDGKIQIVGWNIFEFDLPYLLRRAWRYRLDTSHIQLYRNRYWPEYFIDLREVWTFAKYQAPGNLNDVCRFLGVGEKTGDGADFAQLFYSDKRSESIVYADMDLVLTEGVGEIILPRLI